MIVRFFTNRNQYVGLNRFMRRYNVFPLAHLGRIILCGNTVDLLQEKRLRLLMK